MKKLDIMDVLPNSYASVTEAQNAVEELENSLKVMDPSVEIEWFPVRNDEHRVVPILISRGEYQTGMVTARNRGFAVIY